MNNDVKSLFAERVREFRLPVYSGLPNVGLYLEQVTKYINGLLAPLGFPEITASMISNYVKKGLVDSPVKKQYYAEHIAYLLFVCVGKNVVAIDDILLIYKMQKEVYPCDVAYDYFCNEFHNMLEFTAGIKDTVDNIGITNTELKTALRSIIICASNLAYAGCAISEFKKRAEENE